jgi:hypothetical protein
MNEGSSFFPSYSSPFTESVANANSGSSKLTDDYAPPPAQTLLMAGRDSVQVGAFRYS